MSVVVQPVAGRRDLREFIELPYRLHATSPYWIPPLRFERRQFLNPKRNVFFQHGEAQLFLARRDGRVVGRVSAQINSGFDAQHTDEPSTGMFGFLEFEEDAEIATALLDAAGAWVAGKGRERMLGPMDFTMNDESGVLFEGFDREAMIRQPWHPPYYFRILEELGETKAMDLFMWELVITDRDTMRPILQRLADEAEPKYGITLRKMSRRTLKADIAKFAEVYNAAWKTNWDFVPMDEADVKYQASEFQLVFDKDWFMVAEGPGGEVVGAAISIPDINQVLKKMNGRIFPFGWVHYLRRKKLVTRVRVGFLGVKPEFQHTGIAAKMYVEHFDMAATTPIKWGEMGWILETNKAMNRGMEAMGGRIVKKYRVYERPLAPVASDAP
ncbi:MAG: hypothetical protein JHC95_08730 [Solirubrobacteraceae bacterium]|nr:hypothetical protein [Solirubrobacteraceae bacterium]